MLCIAKQGYSLYHQKHKLESGTLCC